MQNFKDYWSSLKPPSKHELASRAATSYSTLNQVANGHRRSGMSLSARLKQADSNITDEMLRPDLYGDNAHNHVA